MHRVLIVSYYFPPMGGVEVQRVTRFVSHLREYGWEPMVMTTAGGNHASWDATLLNSLPENLKIFRVSALEHYSSVQRMKRLKQGAAVDQKFRNSRCFGDKLNQRLEAFDRRCLCFPDEKNWWAWRAFLPALQVIRRCEPDVIFATGFPWSTLTLAARLSRWTRVPLVVDMRDAWTADPRMWWSSERHRQLEAKVFASAAQVVCATDQMKLIYERLYPSLPFSTVHNACADPAEYKPQNVGSIRRNGRVRFVYTGSLSLGDGQSPFSRTPLFFLKALLELLKNGEVSPDKVAVDFYGVHPETGYTLNDPAEELLDGIVTWHGNVSHEKAFQVQNDAEVLLLFQAKGFEFAVGGKFFEYLMTRKPMLACVPESGEVAEIIKKLSVGLVSNIDDVNGIKVALKYLIAKPFICNPQNIDMGFYTLSGTMQALTEVLESARTAGNPRLRPSRNIS